METATVPLKPNSLTKADFKLIQFFQDPRTKFFNIYFEKKEIFDLRNDIVEYFFKCGFTYDQDHSKHP